LAHVLLWRKRQGPQPDPAIMDPFAPELAQHWLAGQAPAADERVEGVDEDALSLGEQVALEELAERVSAARSVY
jgi:hypothetical protein